MSPRSARRWHQSVSLSPLSQLHRLVFSLRHSKEEREDLDGPEEERRRTGRREAEQRRREKAESDPGGIHSIHYNDADTQQHILA